MFFTGLMVALTLAVLLTMLFAFGFRGQRWGPGLLFFFLLLFLATWAGGVWTVPVGPLMLGVPWLSFLVVALTVALLLTIFIPDRRRPEGMSAEAKQSAQAASDTVAVDVFFWILVCGLLLAITARYVVFL